MNISLRTIKLALWIWVFTMVFGTMYMAGQSMLRNGADDAQVELAEEAVSQLNLGRSPDAILPAGTAVELNDSLRSYILVYDDSGQQIASNVRLDGSTVEVPAEVLEHARNASDHRATWQSTNGVRSSIVIKHFSNAAQSGFVIAGKSLREVEKRQTTLVILCGIGWALTIIPVSVYVWLTNDPKAVPKSKKSTRKK